MRRVKRGPRGLVLAVLAGLLVARAGASAETLRAGTSGDYAPFSRARAEAPDGLDGLDVELLRRFAAERGAELAWLRFTWPALARAMREGAFEVAVGGITVRPERSLLGIFTRPVAITGAVALVRDPARFPDERALAGARIAVNAGGHLERVARERFPGAQIVAVADNGAPPRLLAAGEVDAALSDGAEAPLWQREVPGALQIGPLTRDAKAWWVRADRPELARELDRWLAEREADGSLARQRARHLGAAAPAAAAPLPALLSAIRERLELQPLVAEAKRAAGAAVDAPAQEERVLEAAVAAASDAAQRLGRPPAPEDPIRALFRAQIEAGKAIQARVLAEPPRSGPRYDLDRELRPALARVSARIAALAGELPPTPRAEIDRAAAEALALPALPAAARRALADAIAGLAAPARPRPSTASPPTPSPPAAPPS